MVFASPWEHGLCCLFLTLDVCVCVGGAALSKSYRASRAKEVGSMAESDLVLMYIPPELQEAKCVTRKRP